jgi:hypothetical protein
MFDLDLQTYRQIEGICFVPVMPSLCSWLIHTLFASSHLILLRKSLGEMPFLLFLRFRPSYGTRFNRAG